MKRSMFFAAIATVCLMALPSGATADDNWLTNPVRKLNNALDDAGKKLERFPPTSYGGRKIREQAQENRDRNPELRNPPPGSNNNNDDDDN